MKLFRIFFFSLLVILPYVSLGQINEMGIPLVQNFNPVELKFSDQNWAAVQDPRGVMYFGNQEGYVLEYDGKTWRKIPVKDSKPVRSMAIDSTGTIYVGTVGDFGRLVPNLSGNLIYESLSYLIADSNIVFNDIWKTYAVKNKVYFNSFSNLFCFDGKKLETIKFNRSQKPQFLHKVENDLYLHFKASGIKQLVGLEDKELPGGEFFYGKDIYNILPQKNKNLMMISSEGVFDYNPSKGTVGSIGTKNSFVNRFASEGIPYHNILLSDSTIALGRIYSDEFSLSRITQNGDAIEIINAENGLMDEFVTYLYQRPSPFGSSPLWMCLSNGIAKANIHSPLRRFGESSGIKGIVLDIKRFNGRLYVATFAGLYYQAFDKNGFSYFNAVPEISATVWSLSIFKEPRTGKERLLVGASPKVFEITSDFKVNSIDEKLITFKVYPSRVNPENVYIGATGIYLFKWNGSRWIRSRVKKDDLRSETRYISEDQKGNIWLATQFHGIQRVVITPGDTLVYKYDTNHGLPSIQNLSIFTINNETYFGTSNGIYSFNYEKEVFEPKSFEWYPERLKNKAINKFFETPNGFIFIINDNKNLSVEQFARRQDGSLENINIPFKALPNNAFDVVFMEQNGVMWFGLSKELFSFNPGVQRNYEEPFHTLIRQVTLTKWDSVVFHGAFFKELPDGQKVLSMNQPLKQTPVFSYKYNSFTFDVAATFFENESATEYSFILEGLDKEWSKWSIDPKPIYTNLSEGKYAFKVKARNVFGTESYPAEYRFSITPPWFRSIVALISYVLLLFALIWFIVKWNTRRLIAEKERLEELVRQRTAEVVAQKEEIEKQNEELEHQRDKIVEQNEEIKSSITYASRIQNALLTPMETIKTIFDDFFILFLPRDIVSGDFYWITQLGSRKICAAADCTGHGVPGGFMSMLGMGLLNQIISRNEKISASEILDQLRDFIITSLHQTGKSGENKDGMDISLFVVDTERHTIEFSGANNPLIIIRNEELIQIKGDKMPIGIHLRCDVPFTNNVLEYQPGDMIYTFSDGYQDQFGGPDQRKFMVKNLKDLFLEIHKLPMEEQRDILHQTLLKWHGSSPRIDDVVLIGVKL
jgi:serine phosphatase RsbU (regulator of sigma subunit)/signal peptidase I